jgi:peroxidase
MLPRACSTCRFEAGDGRSNENFGLISMHTLWVREHNRLAREIKLKYYPESTATPLTGDADEDIFQLARKFVIYQIQIITYNEFLPALLGPNESPTLNGYNYDQGLDCRISNEFATAAYRFGHSMLSDNLHLIDVDGTLLGDVSLFASFFQPNFLNDGPLNIDNGGTSNTMSMTGPEKVDAVLNGLRLSTAQDTDRHVVDSVREFLFDTNGAEGSSTCLDLPSLNIQRGRDHGLPTYKDMCALLGTATINTFDDIPADDVTISKFKDAYTSVDQIDLWMGLISESHVEGAAFGPLAIKLMKDQFTRLRDGDPNFYRPCATDGSDDGW